jgi:hypothetical protein
MTFEFIFLLALIAVLIAATHSCEEDRQPGGCHDQG